MHPFATAGSLQKRGDFFVQLGQMLGSGVPVVSCLETLARSLGPRSGLAERLRGMALDVESGHTFAEAMRRHDPGSAFDMALIEAGENSGRLDICCGLLGSFYSDRAKLSRAMYSQLAYPVLLVHLAAFLPSISKIFYGGGVTAWLLDGLTYLAPVYLAVFALAAVTQAQRGEAVRLGLERVWSRVPWLGGGLRDLALARFSLALESLINAGVPLATAWRLAGEASGSLRLAHGVADHLPLMEAGQPPSAWIAKLPLMTDSYLQQYSTAELSGKVDGTLRRLYGQLLESGTSKLTQFAEWLPKLVFFGVAIAIAVKVVGFYTNYFNEVSKVLGTP